MTDGSEATREPEATPAPTPTWDLELDGATHIVTVGAWSVAMGYPHTFTADGVKHDLGHFSSRPVTVPFDIAGHPGSVTLWHTMPRLGTRLSRAMAEVVQGRQRRAFEGKPSSSLGWSVYELRVDEQDRGGWVLTSDRGVFISWRFVPAGGELPANGTPDWPVVGGPG